MPGFVQLTCFKPAGFFVACDMGAFHIEVLSSLASQGVDAKDSGKKHISCASSRACEVCQARSDMLPRRQLAQLAFEALAVWPLAPPCWSRWGLKYGPFVQVWHAMMDVLYIPNPSP